MTKLIVSILFLLPISLTREESTITGDTQYNLYEYIPRLRDSTDSDQLLDHFLSSESDVVPIQDVVFHDRRPLQAVDEKAFDAAAADRRLLKHLFADYNKFVRPVRDRKKIISVYIEPILESLVDVRERLGVLVYVQSVRVLWYDDLLVWNRTEFSSGKVYVPSTAIWNPQIEIMNIMNDPESRFLRARDDSTAIVYHDGLVTVWYSELVHLKCNSFDYRKFPYDTQHCVAVYSPWTNDASQVQLVALGSKDSVDHIREHSEYSVVSLSAKSTQRQYSHARGKGSVKYSELHYTLSIERHAAYYLYNLIVPCFVTATLCVIGMFTPTSSSPERTEKVNLGLTCLLAIAVFLLIVSEDLPRSHVGRTLLTDYLLLEIVICAVATCISIITLTLQKRAVARCWRIPDRLAAIAQLGEKKPERKVTPANKRRDNNLCTTPPRLLRVVDDYSAYNNLHLQHTQQRQRLPSQSARVGAEMLEGLTAVRQSLDAVEFNISEARYEVAVSEAWDWIFNLLDFLFLLLFIAVNAILTFYIFTGYIIYE